MQHLQACTHECATTIGAKKKGKGEGRKRRGLNEKREKKKERKMKKERARVEIYKSECLNNKGYEGRKEKSKEGEGERPKKKREGEGEGEGEINTQKGGLERIVGWTVRVFAVCVCVYSKKETKPNVRGRVVVVVVRKRG